MPVGRHRKAFSSKQKKEQLLAKRERKRNRDASTSSTASTNNENEKLNLQKQNFSENVDELVRKMNAQPVLDNEQNRNRFNLHFLRDTKEELDALKKDASRAIQKSNEEAIESDIDDIYKPSSVLDIPIRPSWNYEMSKEEIEEHERVYFKQYLNRIFSNFDKKKLSYFEMNLETWRQLWRVLEISDIILFIVDSRFPVLHFSPVFYNYITNDLKKECILILNKIDLIPSELVIAWKSYFQIKFPNLHIITFTSVPKLKKNSVEIKRLRQIYANKSHRKLYECVKNITKENVDLDSWSNLISEHLRQYENEENAEHESYHSKLENENSASASLGKNFITLGCCGFPNVGKSSLLNTLMQRKVVSVSRTPGHTKHLQTIFLTPNVRLCDCPGLVFPSLVTKPLQILSGIYPIAQLQEPYSVIRYLAERIPLVEQLQIEHPHKDDTTEWSPLDICEGWALKRRYFTAKAARPDTYRAANEILRMSLEGRICLCLKPKGFSKNKEKWLQHPETLILQEQLKTHDYVNDTQIKIDSEGHDDDIYDEDEQNNDTDINQDPVKKSNYQNSQDASDEDDDENDENKYGNRYTLLSKMSD